MEELIKRLNAEITSLVIRKVLKEILTKLTFLNWWPFSWIVEKVVENIVEKSMRHANLYVTNAIMEYNVENSVENVEEVTDRLIEVQENVDNYTAEELEELDEELISAYRDLFAF